VYSSQLSSDIKINECFEGNIIEKRKEKRETWLSRETDLSE
jgi:hypothetical protein